MGIDFGAVEGGEAGVGAGGGLVSVTRVLFGKPSLRMTGAGTMRVGVAVVASLS